MVDFPLPWERLLWSGRPSLFSIARASRERYLLTDFRLVRVGTVDADEVSMSITDIGEVHRSQSRLDRLTGTSTIIVQPRDDRRPPLVLRGVRYGAQLAALIELIAGDPNARVDPDSVAAALVWQPREASVSRRQVLPAMGAVVMLIAIFGVAIGLYGRTAEVVYAPDDAISPNGQKKDREAIMRFMKDDVMPWARATLGPLTGGPDRVQCETCHGRGADAREWRMPGVAALPEPDVRNRGWEQYGGEMDAQMRNAIYGYLAESDKQTKATYMREAVVPGMARMLHRQPYDFTKPYSYNRQRAAFGCYHCHKVT